VRFAASHDVSTADIPPRQVLQCAATLVLEFDVVRPPWSRRQAWMAPDTGLDTGLLIGTNNVILGAKRLTLPHFPRTDPGLAQPCRRREDHGEKSSTCTARV